MSPVAGLDPEQLLVLARAGSGDALGQLLELYRSYLTLLARLQFLHAVHDGPFFTLVLRLAHGGSPSESRNWAKARAPQLQNLAQLLSMCPRSRLRDASQAVELAKKATELVPQAGHVWNTLGVAEYRAGNWQAAIAALEKSIELDAGIPEWWAQRESYSTFFLALAHWQRGDKDKARQWYDRAVRWMEKHQPKDEELRRFRAEAEALWFSSR